MAQAVEHSLGALTIEFREHAADVIEWARCEAKAVVDLDQRITTGRAKQLHAMIDGAATLDDISAVIREWYQNRGLFAWFKELEPADAITILPMIFADYSSAQGLSGLLNAPYTRVRALLLLLYMSVIGPRRWGPQYAAAIDFVMTSAASGAFGTAAEIQTGEWKSTVVSATAAEPGHIMCEFKSRGAPLTATKRKIRLHTASAMTAVGEVPLSLDPTSFNMGLTMEAGGMTSGHQVTMPRLYFPKNYPLDVQKGTGVPFYIVLRFVGDEERSCVSEVVIPSTGAIFEVPLTAPVP
jgi:hypothetical protein